MMTNKPGCNGPKAFLTGCVPDLEFDGLAVQLDRSDLEVDADGRNVALGVGVIGETEQEARFADAGISDDDDFERRPLRRQLLGDVDVGGVCVGHLGRLQQLRQDDPRLGLSRGSSQKGRFEIITSS